MRLGLGIDTGGTFTDAVIVDLDSKNVIAKAKSPTTYQDLAIGIIASLEEVLNKGGFHREDIGLVGLSTTLATNSILQGKGGEVGLIGMGWTPSEDWKLGCKRSRFIKGGFDSVGRLDEPLDLTELKLAIEEVGQDVDAVVVSGMFSVCNSWQEAEAAQMVKELTSLPVVMGHSLTGELGIMERTVTAVLNARLLPIIDDFLRSVQVALKSLGLHARVLVFKGDGGLMSIETARERPVETILSGPAASLMGGKILAGIDNCIVVDVGGTSTDIAYLDEGFPRINMDGAMVGEWRTRVKAIDMWTCGLGGDSIVQMDRNGEICIGPDRVLPLAMASGMRKDLKEAMIANQESTYYVAGKGDLRHLDQSGSMIYEYLAKNGPRSLFEVMDGVKEVILTKDVLNFLMSRGNVLRTGLTPTDIMHIDGDFVIGDPEASMIGLRMLAAKLDDAPERVAEKIMERAVTRIGEEVVKKAMADDAGPLVPSLAMERMLHAVAGEKVFSHLTMRTSLDRPLVGIGAPSQILVRPLEGRMDAQVIIPPHFDVGNAVGAVCSQISESVVVQVLPRDNVFVVLSQFGSPSEYYHLEEAMQSAMSIAERHVRERVEMANAEDIKVKIDLVDKRFSDGYGKEMKFINFILVKATATGRPRLES